MGGKAQLLRDIRKRISADQLEVQRRAFLYVARNTALSNTVRHKAQLGLNALNGGEGRMHAVKNRCVETGRGRGECYMPSVETALMTGIMSKFGLWRVCLDRSTELTIVSIPSQGAGRGDSRSQQGKLVGECVGSGSRGGHGGGWSHAMEEAGF